MSNNIFTAETLLIFAQRVLQKAGVREEDSWIIADTLLCADLRGIYSHGIGKLDNYTARVEAGVLDPSASLKVERENAVMAVINAHNGFGQVAAYHAMELALKKAKENGIGMVLVNNSNHFGIASYYSLMAAEKKLIGVVATNASPGIAPFGAKEKLFGTNPISIAVPSKSKFPIVLDMSSSVVARGKVRQAITTGGQIPLGWARDKDGIPTTDPAAALKGTLEPISGPKGSGLALMVEIMCGVLSASTLPGEVRMITDTSGPCKTGHLFYAINPESFMNGEQFLGDIDDTISRIKGLSPIDKEVYVPGELEYLNTRKSSKEGILLKDTAIASLNVLSQKYGVSFIGED